MTAVAGTPKLRLSSTLNSCVRKAVLEATVEPDRDWSRKEQGWMFRGRSLGRDFALMLATAAVQDNRNGLIYVDSGDTRWVPDEFLTSDRSEAVFICEQRIPWDLGVGHADVIAVETGTVIEVLSSTSASSDRLHAKLLQAVGYAMHYPDATSACLVVVDHSDMTDDRIVVTKGSRQWDELEAEANDRIAQVLAWKETGEWPARACRKPSDARGYFCRHAVTCFDGWEAPALPPLDDTEARTLTVGLYEAKKTEREVKQQLAVAETARKEIEQKLDPLVDAGVWEVGPYKLVRSDRAKDTFKLANAREDSRFVPELLDEFTKTSRFSVWTVDRVAGDAS